MCGISGVITRAPLTEAHRASVRRVHNALIHRGPDGEGEHASERVLLAMRRLAIIDLTGGWQPLFNEDKSIALVANGEVYNYIELREELRAKGHQFRTGSDCETIIHAYEENGTEFVHRLRGMYAFALHDIRNRRVILGRDRMGEKPMYLCEQDGAVWFGSELRAMMAGGFLPFKMDPGAINLYYHYGFVPEPRTPIVGLTKLPAGHVMEIDLADWKVKTTCYWRLDDAPPVEGDAPKLIRAELERVAELITRADVPVGVALSAGIDSAAVAALVAKARPGQVHALTVGYPGRPPQDERNVAQRWAGELGMPFHDVEVSVREFTELFAERAIWRDDPICDIAGHNYYAVSRLAYEKRIPVLIMGQGGDELFWGYPWLRSAAKQSRLKAAGRLNGVSANLRRLRAMAPQGLSVAGMRQWAMAMLGHMYGYAQADPDLGQPEDRLVGYNACPFYQIGAFGASRVMAPAFREAATTTDPGSLFTFPRPWGDTGVMLTKMICDTYLLENGMVQGDRLSMVNSVELRLPLSDYRLAELAVGLRKASPDEDLPAKHHLKEAIKDVLPEWLLNRPKTGFSPPTRTWIPALVKAYYFSLEDGLLVSDGVIDPRIIPRLRDSRSRHSPWSLLFYSTLLLEFWARGVASIAGAPLHHSLRVPLPA